MKKKIKYTSCIKFGDIELYISPIHYNIGIEYDSVPILRMYRGENYTLECFDGDEDSLICGCILGVDEICVSME